jgi:tetratricopeptide (TPR) repeat protein
MTNEIRHSRAPGGRDDLLQHAASALDGERPHDAERIAGELLKVDPRNAQALHIFGCALLMQDRAQEAIAPLEAAARSSHDAKFDTMLAIALRQANRHEDALSRLKRATKRRPPYGGAFLELGRLHLSMRRYDEAIEAFNRGLEIAPMMPDLSIQLGHAHLQRRNFASAKAAFATALGISPNSHDALLGMASAHFEGGEYRPAADYLRRCLANKPNDSSLWLNLGHCLLALGQRDAGYDCFRTAARGDQTRYGRALGALARAGRGRFWLKPSDAARFLKA